MEGRQYAERWATTAANDITGRDAIERRLRLHVYPLIGSRPVVAFQPAHVRDFLEELKCSAPTGSYRRLILGAVSAVFGAAVDDLLISRNPCEAKSVKAPQSSPTRVTPLPAEQVFAVRAALPCPRDPGRWSTWAADASYDRARYSACPSMK